MSTPWPLEHILLESVDPGTGNMVPGVVAASPERQRTAFYDARTAGRSPDPTLQQQLSALINGKRAYKAARRNFAVALVDLSGANKFAPTYAGFNDLANFYGGSVNKLTGLLGVYQLLAEAGEQLKANPAIGDAATLEAELKSAWANAGIPGPHHPLVSKILTVAGGAPPTVSLRPELTARLDSISDGNQNGSTSIVLLRYPFIGSTLLAHGLFSPANKAGIWSAKTFGKIDYLNQRLELQGWPSRENPFPRLWSDNINAVSVAQFYTLAAQGRLIDGASSNAILTHLNSGGCTSDDIDVTALEGSGTLATKCGIYKGWVHNTMHFEEPATLREFVIVILTQNHAWATVQKDLFQDVLALLPS